MNDFSSNFDYRYMADFEAQRRLWSASSLSLNVRRTRLSTVSDRAFHVTAARTWNSLSQHVTSTPSMSVFRGRLKAFLLRRSFPWLLPQLFYSVCAVTVVIFGYFNRSFYLLTYLLLQLTNVSLMVMCADDADMPTMPSRRPWSFELRCKTVYPLNVIVVIATDSMHINEQRLLSSRITHVCHVPHCRSVLLKCDTDFMQINIFQRLHWIMHRTIALAD